MGTNRNFNIGGRRKRFALYNRLSTCRKIFCRADGYDHLHLFYRHFSLANYYRAGDRRCDCCTNFCLAVNKNFCAQRVDPCRVPGDYHQHENNYRNIFIMNLEILNEKYRPLSPGERVRELYRDFSRVLFTSSFGTTSAILLDLFHKVNPKQDVYFLDTTYHFAETVEYKILLTR